MQLFLGVDGGGTGCRVVLANGQGRVLARGEGGAANIASDPDGALANILLTSRAAVAAAFGDAGVEAVLPRIKAGLGLAGANTAGAGLWLQRALPFGVSRVVTDGVTAVKGALGDADGIVAAIGTGSVFAVQRQGHQRQIGGWGLALGDEGSGAVLGRTVLRRVLRAHDGLCAMTPYLQGVFNGFETPERIVAFSLAAKPVDYARLVPDLLAAQDDPAAEAILGHAVESVAASIARLQEGGELPVTFIGGLGETYAARVQGWVLRPALGSALDGALLLARGL